MASKHGLPVTQLVVRVETEHSLAAHRENDWDGWADRRAETRMLAVLRVGKLICNGEESLCRIRNISSRGVMVQTSIPPVAGLVDIEIREREPLRGRVAWRVGERVGIAFLDSIDLDTALVKVDGGKSDHRSRATRIEAPHLALVRTTSSYLAATIENLSQTGCRIAADESVAKGDDIVLHVERMIGVPATVRWYSHGRAGIAFSRPLSFDQLAHWLWLAKQLREPPRSIIQPRSSSK